MSRGEVNFFLLHLKNFFSLKSNKTMKNYVLALLLTVSTASFSLAQKIGYVNTKEVMSKMEEYTTAQSDINATSQKWQEELEKMYKVIQDKYKDYQANEVIMPESMRKDKQDEIFNMEKDAKEYREKKFGYTGELFQLQESKIKPIQDKVMKTVEAVAVKKRLDLIFDKASGDVTWLYTNANFDITPDVQKELGLEVSTPGAEAGSGTKPNPAVGGAKRQ